MEIIRWYSSYLTNWILTTFVLNLTGFLPTDSDYTVVLLLRFLLLGGPYITYINPRRIQIQAFNGLVLEGTQLRVLDFVFHVMPYIVFSFHNRAPIQRDSVIPFYTVLLSYICVNNPVELYGISVGEIVGLILFHHLVLTH